MINNVIQSLINPYSMSNNRNTAGTEPKKRYANSKQILLLAIYFAFTGILLLENVYNFWPDTEEVTKDKSIMIELIGKRSQSLREELKTNKENRDTNLVDLEKAIKELDSTRYKLLTLQEQSAHQEQQVYVTILFQKCTPFSADKDHSLLLLVLIMGAVGSWLHAVSSFLDFVGNRNFVTSWFTWYLMRPILGAMMAVVFYLVIRAGLFPQSGVGIEAINPFSIAALAGLVGLSTQRASKKLADVFDALFPTLQKDKDALVPKLQPSTISLLSPAQLTVDSTDLDVTVTGTNFTEKSVALVNGKERKSSCKSDETLEFSLLPEDVSSPGELQITVYDPALKISSGNSVFLTVVEKTT
jgi:hypothetical protein